MDLNALRIEIDKLDKVILESFEKRMELCRNVALYKKENNMQIFQSEREKQIIEKVMNNSRYYLFDGNNLNLLEDRTA